MSRRPHTCENSYIRVGAKQCSGPVTFLDEYGCGSVPKSSVTFRMQKKQFFHIFNVLINEISKLQNCKNMFDDFDD